MVSGCCRPRIRDPALGPFADGCERVLEGASLFGQFVFHPHGRFRHDRARDNPFRLELPEAFGQLAVADIGNGGAQLGIAHAAVKQELNHRTRPAAPDQLHGAMESGAERRPATHTWQSTRLAPLDTIYLLIYSDFALITIGGLMSVSAGPALTTWTIDPVHTMAEFAVKHLMITTVKGRFTGVSGTIRIDDSNPANGDAEVVIDAATIDTREPQRDAHLRSADFFDVEKFPTLTFRSARLFDVSGGAFKLAGQLTIHGVTRDVVLDVTSEGRAKDPWGGERAGFAATTKIHRGDFGLRWNQALETGGFVVGDEVKISLDVQVVKQ
jgi:polyisoprenoid-binding protein YceI